MIRKITDTTLRQIPTSLLETTTGNKHSGTTRAVHDMTEYRRPEFALLLIERNPAS